MANTTLKLQNIIVGLYWSKTGPKRVFWVIMRKIFFLNLLVLNSKSAFSLVGYNYPKIKKSQKKYEKSTTQIWPKMKLSFIQCTMEWSAQCAGAEQLRYLNKVSFCWTIKALRFAVRGEVSWGEHTGLGLINRTLILPIFWMTSG